MNIVLKNIIPTPMIGQVFHNDGIWHKTIEFEKGDYYLIKAQSGAGKSSLMSFLYGLRFDYEGEILFDNKNGKSIPLTEWIAFRQNKLAAVFQTLSLFDDLTLLENIQVKNELSTYKTQAEIESLLTVVGMLPYLNKKVGLLSMGQKQRVAIVRALCQPFEWILLDEPFSHLDKTNADLAFKLILTECKKQEAGLILTSLGNEFENSNLKILNL